MDGTPALFINGRYLGGNQPYDEIAKARDATPNQIKLAWLLLRSPVIAPIPGTLDISHLRENLAALELELSDDELERLGS